MTVERFSVQRISPMDKHHFFGFHDLPITDASDKSWLALAIDDIRGIPMPGDSADLVLLSPGEEKRVVGKTNCFNYPQGARQQWIGKSQYCLVNNAPNKSNPTTDIYNSETGELEAQIPASTYCVDSSGTYSYSVDFGRLQRLGGYGHASVVDKTEDEAIPAGNGIFKTNLNSGSTKLLLSIAEVAKIEAIGGGSSPDHFLTHLRLSPDEKRIAFLHRYRLPDGGEDNRLLTIGVDGNDCRLVARGFLSHFDWLDERSIMIWGRKAGVASSFRTHPLAGAPIIRNTLPLLKKVAQTILRRGPQAMSMSYLNFVDQDFSADNGAPFAKSIIQSDGHPMTNPNNRNMILADTYPDHEGVRDLLVYNRMNGEKTILGYFKKLDELPNEASVQSAQNYIDDFLAVEFSADQYAFTRSGLHCDLHPRWTSGGTIAAFDSIHEGMRQIYSVDVSELLGEI